MNKIIFIGLILIVAGCAVGPKYTRPNTKKPEAYTQSAVRTDSITNLKWWEVYQDTVLQTLIQKAIDQNLDLKIAIARIEQSKAILGFNKANLLAIPGLFCKGPSKRLSTTLPPKLTLHSHQTHFHCSAMYRGKLIYGANFVTPIVQPTLNLLASEEDRKSVYIIMVARLLNYTFNFVDWMNDSLSHNEPYETRKEYLRIIALRFERVKYRSWTNCRQKISPHQRKHNYTLLSVTIIRTENAINILLGQTYIPVTTWIGE